MFSSFYTKYIGYINENYDKFKEVEIKAIEKGFKYMSNFSMVNDDQIFKICVEFWLFISNIVRNKSKNKKIY